MCFRILDIIQRWAELILSPLRCRSIAKALAWSYLVSRFDLNPMRVALHLRRGSNVCRKRIIGCRSGPNREELRRGTAIHQLELATIIQIINIYHVLYPLTSVPVLPSCCFFSSLRLILLCTALPSLWPKDKLCSCWIDFRSGKWEN